jgi:hypothetical protein
MTKVNKSKARKLYNSGISIFLSNGIELNIKEGINLQWGNEKDFEYICKDYKFFNKRNPIFFNK